MRAVAGEKTAFAYSDDISEAALMDAAHTVRTIAASGQSRRVKVGGPKQKLARSHVLYAPMDPIATLDSSQKVALLEKVEKLARAKDPRIKQVMASVAGEYDVVLVARADGTLAADVRPLVRLSVTVIAEQTIDGELRRESGSGGGGGRFGLGYFQDPVIEQYVGDAVRAALTNLESRPAPAGEMSVVLGAGWPGILLHEAIGHGLEGDFNRKGSSAFAGRIGQRVAARGVTVLDDGTLPDRRGSLNVDDEGNPSQRNVLIEDGILKGYIQDSMNARLMKVKPTGNGRRESYAAVPMPRMTNTYMLGGNKSRRGDRRRPEARPVCDQFRRRPGRHHQRQIRLLGQRGILGRERQDPVSGQGRDADRQRTRRADPGQRDRQRHEARQRRRHLRQGRPERAGRRRPADPADRPPDGRRHRLSGCLRGVARRGVRARAQRGLPTHRSRGGTRCRLRARCDLLPARHARRRDCGEACPGTGPRPSGHITTILFAMRGCVMAARLDSD